MATLESPSRRNSTFIFMIGPSAKQYPLPSLLLAPHSALLSAMVSDSSTACAYLPDCDTATFERFVAFLHHGDFASPLFQPIPRRRSAQRYRTRFLPPAPLQKSRATRATFAAFATARRYAYPSRLVRYDNAWEDSIDDRGAPALCAVARVYLLAQRYGVKTLRRLCLHKLHRLVVCVREIWDGLHFLRLCGVRDGGPPPLRRLAFLYCLFHYEDLRRRPEFPALMKEAPEFAAAVMDGLAEFKAKDTVEID